MLVDGKSGDVITPAAAAIANASDITKLKAAWNTSLLGAADWIES